MVRLARDDRATAADDFLATLSLNTSSTPERSTTMSKVFAGASMSIDGYIAGPNESGFDQLFKWYGNGDVEIPTANPEMTVRLSPGSAEHYHTILDQTGVLVCGRRLFDMTRGWGGRHPMDRPLVVVTHRPPPDDWSQDAPFEFIEGIEAAIARAREIAGDKIVGVNGGTIATQCLNAGLLDEVWVDLVPVLLGGGTPFFSGLENAPAVLEGPISSVQGIDVTHLRYRVRYS
jgi:dihydrofolate reductase